MKCIPHLIREFKASKIVVLLVIILLVSAGCSSNKNIRADDPGSTNKQNINKPASSGSKKANDKDIKTYRTALAMMEERNYLQAYELFKRVSDNNPDLSGPLINMGIIALKQDNNLQAESYFQQAIKSKSDNAIVYNYLGIAYRQQGRFADADIAYKMALKLDDTMAKTYLNLGILNDLYLGDFHEAQKNYLKYQQLEPGNKQVDAWLLDLNSRIQASVE